MLRPRRTVDSVDCRQVVVAQAQKTVGLKLKALLSFFTNQTLNQGVLSIAFKLGSKLTPPYQEVVSPRVLDALHAGEEHELSGAEL